MILYAGQMLVGLALLALQGVALWGAVELIHFLYCKATGRTY